VNDSFGPKRSSELLVELNSLVDRAAPDAAGACEDVLEQLKQMPTSHANKDLVECLLVIAKYYCHSGGPALAVRSASLAVSQAHTLEDKRLLRKAYTFRGCMRHEAGDTSGCLEDCLVALKFARELGEPGLERPVWNNIGIALMQAGQYAEAMSCLERAAVGPLVAQDERDYFYAIPYENIASCAISARDSRKGLDAAMTAIRLNPSPATSEACLGRVIAEANLARLLIQVGDLVRASVHSQTARAFASVCPTNRANYIAENAAGLVDIHCGRIDAGTACLSANLKQVREFFPGQLHDALTACAAGYEAAGKPELALGCLHELLGFNRERRISEITRFQLFSQENNVRPGEVTATALDPLTVETMRLRVQIDVRVQQLIHTAVSAGVASGYDLYRIFRVSKMATGFAESLKWSSEQIEQTALSARLFDIGMIAMAEPLLTRPGALSASERKLVNEHARIGAELLAAARLTDLEACVPVARLHHERWDGSGPRAMRGYEIPKEVRLIALCDALDALTHTRPWRPAIALPAALLEIGRCAGSQFDPEMTARFVSHVSELYRRVDNLEGYLSAEAKENCFVRMREQIAAMVLVPTLQYSAYGENA